MRITSNQSELLNSFICERLSANAINESLINSFVSKRGESLVLYLKMYGIKEEKSGEAAYYIIKTKENEILMFFSIKCGALFVPMQNEEIIEQDYQRLLILFQAMINASNDNHNAERIAELLGQEIGDEASFRQVMKKVFEKLSKKGEILHSLNQDKLLEENEMISRVWSTRPGVELTHFCINDNMKEKWKTYNLNHAMGETLFWKFIAPKFFEIQAIAGCEYAFLFAADLSEDGSLVNYYDVTLKFQKRQDIGANKPLYDFCCQFMCQDINMMKGIRDDFFENFNIGQEEDIV